MDNMNGAELRARIDRLEMTYIEAAERLGLSLAGLHHQMRGERAVTRQTEMLLEVLELQTGRRNRRLTTRLEREQEKQRTAEAQATQPPAKRKATSRHSKD
jgi:hypothetical protein